MNAWCADMVSRRILVVDDDTRLLALLADLLGDLGYLVTATSDPRQALQLVSDKKFDLAFLDIFLGDLRGTDLMREMAGRDPELYFVIMTASGSTSLAMDCLQKGASDFIMKPFFEEDLVRSIEIVNRRREIDRRQRGLAAEIEIRIREKTEDLVQGNFLVLAALVRAVENKGFGGRGHSTRVSRYAGAIADRIGLASAERDQLQKAALLHDIGKIGISDSILGKPASLTPSEIEIVRTHPVSGTEILKPMKYYSPLLPAVLHHHERYDGTGYPLGLRGKDIPLAARIIAVADACDAILSNRPYRAAAGRVRAIEELRAGAGTQFDPEVAALFIDETEREPSLLSLTRAAAGARAD